MVTTILGKRPGGLENALEGWRTLWRVGERPGGLENALEG